MRRWLTPAQEAFVRGVLEGKTQTQAYIDAGYQSRGITATKKASKLIRQPHMRARLEELQHATAVTEGHLHTLAVLRDGAAACGRYSAAIQAEIARGRVAGLYPARGAAGKEPAPAPADPFEQMSDEELDATVRELGRHPTIRAILERDDEAAPTPGG